MAKGVPRDRALLRAALKLTVAALLLLVAVVLVATAPHDDTPRIKVTHPVCSVCESKRTDG